MKMENFKIFNKAQTANRVKEIIQTPTDKSFLRKNILTEI